MLALRLSSRVPLNHLCRAHLFKCKQRPRTMITSAQKRALQKEQIDGSGKKSNLGNNSTAKPPIAGASPTVVASNGGGSASTVPLLLAATGAVGAGAYYMDLIPFGEASKEVTESDEALSGDVETVEQEVEEKIVGDAKEMDEVMIEVSQKKEEIKSESASFDTNRVTSIHVPSTKGRRTVPQPEIAHREGGSRVSVENFSAVYGGNTTSIEEKSIAKAPTKGPATTDNGSRLKSPPLENDFIDADLAKAHASMKASINESYLQDLDGLSPGELRIRVVQLASEMSDRTKWEAVRLREFLAMKEKEVGDKYLDMMQKQRLEYENLHALRMREQEAHITKTANEALEAKDKSIESVVNAASVAQEVEYKAALKTSEELFEREINAKYESEFGAKLAEAKSLFANDLQEKIALLVNLAKRLETAEQHLKISRNFESGSQRAHRVSAAALALAEKMETNKGATEEFVALKSAAVENGVIASALDKIPLTVKKGIPTLPELQSKFDEVYSVSRQAAYVPRGRSGLEGQLAGKVFATLSLPPTHDKPPPTSESQGKMADYILARATYHIKLGDLEQAVKDLDQLSGQVAFSVKDWKSAAMDRVAVDKALKVIKMECALMNQNMVA
mmetsp:Transcript_9988/g.15072  ORF Transcript_9988/g.15072 Transcript_9988/m.15072 type:complete len:620 (-) Transcript_9988:1667-3526(-)